MPTLPPDSPTSKGRVELSLVARTGALVGAATSWRGRKLRSPGTGVRVVGNPRFEAANTGVLTDGHALSLTRLSALEDGWLDGAGHAPSKGDIAWLQNVWPQFWPKTLPAPYAYPTEAGGIQLEWDEGLYAISLELRPGARSAELLIVDVSECGEPVVDCELDLNVEQGWRQLVQVIGRTAYGRGLR